jgi:hypothetical protein
MRLPNSSNAVVDIAKLRDYVLSPTHEEGKSKARVFLSSLGITAADAPLLRQWLLNAATSADASLGVVDGFGQRYVIDFPAHHKSRRADIRSAWIIRAGENFPRLITCYVL